MVKDSVKGLIAVALAVLVTAIVWIDGAMAVPPPANCVDDGTNADNTLFIDSCQILDKKGFCYILSADLVAAPGQSCLTVAADKITIDLHGHSITGVAGPAGIEYGACLPSNPAGCTTRVLSCTDVTCIGLTTKGLITGFVTGVDLGAGYVNEIRNIDASGNVVDGIKAGEKALVKDSMATGNTGGDGIAAGDASQLLNNVSSGNGGNGIECGERCLIKASTIEGNSQEGLLAGDASQAVENVSSGNGFNGIVCGDRCLIKANTSEGNTDEGIVCGDACTVVENVANGNDSGIECGNRCFVKNNIANDNTTPLFGHGISVGWGATVDSNTAKGNAGIGIQVDCLVVAGHSGSSVTNNKASSYAPAALEGIPPHPVGSCFAKNNIIDP